MSTINDTSKLRNKDGDACTLSGLLSPGVINVLIESIFGSLALRAAVSARSM